MLTGQFREQVTLRVVAGGGEASSQFEDELVSVAFDSACRPPLIVIGHPRFEFECQLNFGTATLGERI